MAVFWESNMTRRSIPIPHPPVGGRPCSRDTTYEYSLSFVSSDLATPRKKKLKRRKEKGRKAKGGRQGRKRRRRRRRSTDRLMIVSLRDKAVILFGGIVQFGVSVAYLHLSDEELESLRNTGLRKRRGIKKEKEKRR